MSDVTIVLIIIIILSLGMNGIVILALLKRWSRLASQDIVLLSLSICDFCQTMIGYPLEINSDMRREQTKCIIAGYSTTSLALVSISLLTALSIGRMLSMAYPLRCYTWMQRKSTCLYFIIPSVIYGIVWGSLPLFGWSKYTTELQSDQRCSINLNDQTFGTVTYLYFLLVFCYIVPVVIMTFCFIKILKELKRMTSSIGIPTGSGRTRGSYKSERRFSILLLVMLTAFLLAWTPYASIVFLLSFGKNITLAWADSAALLGKSSVLCNPVIYALLYKNFRKSVTALFGRFGIRIGISEGTTECP